MKRAKIIQDFGSQRIHDKIEACAIDGLTWFLENGLIMLIYPYSDKNMGHLGNLRSLWIHLSLKIYLTSVNIGWFSEFMVSLIDLHM